MALCDAPEAPHVIAFDRASGDVRWVACGEESGFRYLRQVSDGIVYVVHGGQPDPSSYSAFDADDGHLVADAPSPPPQGRQQTTVVDGVTIRGGQDDPTSARDANGRVLWSQPGHWVYDDVAAIADGAVFALEFLDSGGARLVAYEIDTGELRWSTPGDSDPIPWGLSPWAADDGQVFAGWTNVHVLNTTDGTPIWSTDWPTIVEGAPSAVHISGLAVDDDNVYVGIVSELGPGD
jgi:outer membrane protein assembly factor BamB